MLATDVPRMIERCGQAIGLPVASCCHTFRVLGSITAYLENDGTVEKAQAIAVHDPPMAKKLCARRSDAVSLDEIERSII